MAKYFCKTKCFYRDALWLPGESLEAEAGEKLPEHFTKDEVQFTDPSLGPPEAVALSQLGTEEARKNHEYLVGQGAVAAPPVKIRRK